MEHVLEDTRLSLVPSRTNTNNSMNDAVQDKKKRKRCSIGESESQTWFDAKIVSPASTASAVSFSPISTVLRAHIPLAWLGGRQVCDSLPVGSVLEAIIPDVSRWDYHVLIARHVPNGTLYAIERIMDTTFVCHPLQTWVCQTWIQQAAIGAAPPVDLNILLGPAGNRGHLRKSSSISISSSQQLPTAPSSPKLPNNRRGVLARRSILDKDKRIGIQEPQHVLDQGHLAENEATVLGLETNESASDHTELMIAEHRNLPQSRTSAHPNSPKDQNSNSQGHVTMLAEHHEQVMDQDETDHLSREYLRRRYLETLYLSKTSLAFYAKGPLSRTRARTRMSGSTVSSEQLAQYYRDIILPAKKLDLKYKESVKAKITALPKHEIVDLEHPSPVNVITSNPKKTKKTKLGRDALWPCENELIEQWWMKRDYKKQDRSTDAQVAELHDALSQLRMRETELQIILTLEVMALEIQSQFTKVNGNCQDGQTSDVLSLGLEKVSPTDKQPPARKQRDLDRELEALLDRLCIWHSIDLEADVMSAHGDQASGSASTTTVKDRLRDFCKDVIIPFYGGKLPEKCRLVCKCLGGPELTPQTTRTASINRPAPGSVVTSRKPVMVRRTLEKVLSEGFSVHHPVPTLTRSSTVPLAPAVKREPSERPKSRSAMHKSISFTNREIDLVADAKATATKRRKLDIVAAQKRDLEAAIEALKKPNRSMVAKDIMDDIEKRTSEDRAITRRIEPIQISATPRHGRFRPDEEDKYDLPSMPFPLSSREEPVIPSSTVKSQARGFLPTISHCSAKKQAVISAINDTPSRQHAQSLPLDELTNISSRKGKIKAVQRDAFLVGSTPLTSRWSKGLDASIPVTPLGRKESHQSMFFTNERSTIVNNIEQAFRDVSEIPHAAGKAMDRVMGNGQGRELETSIYESLGWDDDDDP